MHGISIPSTRYLPTQQLRVLLRLRTLHVTNGLAIATLPSCPQPLCESEQLLRVLRKTRNPSAVHYLPHPIANLSSGTRQCDLTIDSQFLRIELLCLHGGEGESE